ncbi:putative membrane component, COG4392 [Cupriavidus taiwanensis]|uniref:Membrane component, COG4392 n=1 Tax=Cupriavidus taiwanensis TaxID=164546 RepID=A0A976AZ07_9BURK|nr:AzlD domain-containing protein [Cupriavidus taiwanensis]SOZ60748.1 putative membrane component, COG4392 [Cupriavidus taiwanensis]SOZ60892.1 putative membrane component, COG4392 [Cupriavidus taiwanensis]SOZ64799.1 putative membrane component, COG4392 [Cupriavidus taiwanensis]SPA06806.1 putative membrane component, COG4392 [Cupriavidus taiwanensis]
MSHTEVWIALVGMAVVTVITRALFLMAGEHITVPDRIQRALRYAPAAALAAIILPDLMTWQGHFTVALTNYKLMAGVAATAFYLVTRKMVGMIVVGMAVYTGLRMLGG